MRRVHVYDERTGDPAADNAARRLNTALTRWMRARKPLRVVAPSRRRRAAVMRAEAPGYAALVAQVARMYALPPHMVIGGRHTLGRARRAR